MKNWPAFFNELYSKIGGDIPYLHIAYKAVLALFAAFILWLILKRFLSSVQKQAAKYEFIQINDQMFLFARRAILYGLILATGAYLMRLFNIRLLEKPFYALLIILLASPVKDFLIILLKYLEANIADKTETKADNIVFDLLNKFASAIIYATAIILALDMLGINVMPFIAGAGVAGIAIGFAAKDTLSNLIAGILLIIDRPFEIGDRIEVWSAPAGSATWGDVIDIGLRATKIKTTDNIVIIIPNNEIMMRDIVNYTIITSKIRVRINIGISYDANIRQAKDIVCGVAESADWIAKDPPPKVVVRNFGESSVDLQLRVWIEDARRRMDTISHIMDHVKTAFDDAGIEIPYPKRDISITHLGDVSPDAPVRGK
jgi:small-conductance mechanosensitive channel